MSAGLQWLPAQKSPLRHCWQTLLCGGCHTSSIQRARFLAGHYRWARSRNDELL